MHGDTNNCDDNQRVRDSGGSVNRALISGSTKRDIGWAIKQMWNGQKVTRIGWNGRGQFLAMQVPDKNSKMSLPYIYISTVQGDLVPWLASQTDLLATDWQMFEAE